VAGSFAAAAAWAQPAREVDPGADAVSTPPRSAADAPRADASFGPRIVIERIEIAGNRLTAEHLIRRALPVAPGDALRAGDPRLAAVRYKLLALGYFREVTVALRKGSRRGHVVLAIAVEERGTVVLNKIYLGTSGATPWWAGVDLGDRNFAGLGVEIGGGAVYAADSDLVGGTPQWAAQLRGGIAPIGDTAIGAHAAVTHIDASEPYRTSGESSSGAPADFRAFSYRRTGALVGAAYDLTPLARVTVDARFEQVDAELPAAPMRELPDGNIVPVDLQLEPGDSRLATAALAFERDTRPDPVLPFTGDRLALRVELGQRWLGGDYEFATLLGRYERWFPVAGTRHVVSLHVTGGCVLGDAPRFERFYVGDLNRLITPRALGLVVSTVPSRDLLGTSADAVTYGEIAGLAEVGYTYRLFRRRGLVYGGDLFVGVGAIALATRDQLGAGRRAFYRALPVDLVFDFGLKLDTEVGIFELTFANALGRVPL
jgi:hypothetical protein